MKKLYILMIATWTIVTLTKPLTEDVLIRVYTLLGAITHQITDLLVVNMGILTTQTVSHLEMVGF